MSPRALRHLLLVLCLILAQAGGLAHAIGHSFESPDSAPPDAPVCEQCLLYGHLGAAVPSTPAPCGSPGDVPDITAVVAVSIDLPRARAYRSRAPPFLLAIRR